MADTIYYADLEVTAVYDPGDYMTKVTLYEVIAWEADGRPCYHLAGTDPAEPTDDIAAASPMCTAEIRWDGCTHWWLSDDGYIHLCGRSDAERFSRIFLRVFDDAAARTPRFDKVVAAR